MYLHAFSVTGKLWPKLFEIKVQPSKEHYDDEKIKQLCLREAVTFWLTLSWRTQGAIHPPGAVNILYLSFLGNLQPVLGVSERDTSLYFVFEFQLYYWSYVVINKQSEAGNIFVVFCSNSHNTLRPVSNFYLLIYFISQ